MLPDLKPEHPSNQEIFPVSAFSVDSTLGTIASSPGTIFVEGLNSLIREDPELMTLIGTVSNKYQKHEKTILEGAVWTRYILKTQAISVGQQLPILNRDGLMSFLQSSIEKRDKDGSILKESAVYMDILDSLDPEIARAIREMSRYRHDSFMFELGATATYQSLRRMYASVELSRSLQ